MDAQDVAARIDRLTLGAGEGAEVPRPARLAHAMAAVDGSEASRPVIGWAAALGKAYDGHVEAVVVGPPRESYERYASRGSEWAAVTQAWHQEAAEAAQVAKEAEAALKHAEVAGEAKVLHGDTVAELVSHAERSQTDVVVLGSHGDSPIARLALGSVAEGVKERVEQTVLIARGTPPPERILAATDGSLHSRRAVAQALDLAQRWQAELTIVHAHHLPRIGSDVAAEDAVRELLRDQSDVAAEGVRYRLVLGKPAKVILEEQERLGAGLVVLGRRGLGPLAGMLMGSVSAAVVRRAPCAVLVVS